MKLLEYIELLVSKIPSIVKSLEIGNRHLIEYDFLSQIKETLVNLDEFKDIKKFGLLKNSYVNDDKKVIEYKRIDFKEGMKFNDVVYIHDITISQNSKNGGLGVELCGIFDKVIYGGQEFCMEFGDINEDSVDYFKIACVKMNENFDYIIGSIYIKNNLLDSYKSFFKCRRQKDQLIDNISLEQLNEFLVSVGKPEIDSL